MEQPCQLRLFICSRAYVKTNKAFKDLRGLSENQKYEKPPRNT